MREKTGYNNSSKYFEAVLKHDPAYLDFYLFLSGSSTIYAGQPEKTIDIIDRGLRELSPNQPTNSYFIWRYKAVDELLFLGDGKAAQRSFSTAADWARKSNDPDAGIVANLSQKTADFLEDNSASSVAQIDAWSSLLSTALDNETRARAIKKIEGLGGSVIIDESGQVSIRYEKAEDRDSGNN